MSSRPPCWSLTPAILLLAIIVAGLIAWPALWPAQGSVQFRTDPSDFGHEAAAPAEFVFALRPHLA
jgi:hypothetical protein